MGRTVAARMPVFAPSWREGSAQLWSPFALSSDSHDAAFDAARLDRPAHVVQRRSLRLPVRARACSSEGAGLQAAAFESRVLWQSNRDMDERAIWVRSADPLCYRLCRRLDAVSCEGRDLLQAVREARAAIVAKGAVIGDPK
jgi:hypothetical protein